jgi:hypothetical protein
LQGIRPFCVIRITAAFAAFGQECLNSRQAASARRSRSNTIGTDFLQEMPEKTGSRPAAGRTVE